MLKSLVLCAIFATAVASKQFGSIKIPGKLAYNKIFDNGDSIYIEIRCKQGFVNGIVEYLDGSGVPVKFLDYYVSGNSTDTNESISDDDEKWRAKRQSQPIPQLTLVQEIPQLRHQQF